jgi:hypothetical protein
VRNPLGCATSRLSIKDRKQVRRTCSPTIRNSSQTESGAACMLVHTSSATAGERKENVEESIAVRTAYCSGVIAAWRERGGVVNGGLAVVGLDQVGVL